MKRRSFLFTLGCALAIAAPLMAEPIADQVVRQLVAQGYSQISVETTLLGRLRILAARQGGKREIILNPNTGEILRDLWTGADGQSGQSRIIDDGDNSGKGSSGGDDNSGSGGGDDNGGSGGGSSGSGGGDDNSGSGSDDDNSGSDDSDDNGGSGSGGDSDDDSGSDSSGSGGGDDRDRDKSDSDND